MQFILVYHTLESVGMLKHACAVNFGFHGFPCYDRGIHVIQLQYSHGYFY